MDTISTLARFGIFFIALLFFTFATGIIGLISTRLDETENYWAIVAWIVACFIYALTFAILYKL